MQQNLPKKGKLLALDLGTRHTGVAITDELQRVAFLRPEINHKDLQELKITLDELIKDEVVTGIIVGSPVKLDGKETTQTQITKDNISALKLDLPILFVDERLTTAFASQTQQKDSRSAQIMLERYLELIQNTRFAP